MARIIVTWCAWAFAAVIATTAVAAERQKLPGQIIMPSQTKTSGEVSYECPANLTGVHVSIESSFTAPSGWTPKNNPTIYNSLSMTRVQHAVAGNRLWCTYAGNSLPGTLRTTSMSRPVPTGKTCTADAGFRFTCR